MPNTELWTSVERIARDLAAYRGSDFTSRGRAELGQLIAFDARVQGHYGHSLIEADGDGGVENAAAIDLLRRQDPSGITYGLLVREMVRATIEHASVRLDRVLDEPGYVDHLRRIVDLRADIEAAIAGPAMQFKSSAAAALAAINPDLGEPNDLELAVCMRDALHALDTGLHMHWLQCEPWGDDASVRATLHGDLLHFATLAEFASSIRSHDMLPGAYVARIGGNDTAVGIKLPGRIALLSTMVLNPHQGRMCAEWTNHGFRPGHYDLDQPSERYPQWVRHEYPLGGGNQMPVDAGLAHMRDLPRDCVLWLAMVVELQSKRISEAKPESIVLCETLGNALGYSGTPSAERLPALSHPNWLAKDFNLERAFEDLDLSPWANRYLRPALEGLRAKHFLPVGEKRMAMNLRTKDVVEFHEGSISGTPWYDYACLRPASASLLGSREDIEALRAQMFMRNLAEFVLGWGRVRFSEQWGAYKREIRDRLMQRARDLCALPWATQHRPDHLSRKGVHLYRQSARHKTYRAMCVFDGKSSPDMTIELRPASDGQIAEMLGVCGPQDLPEFLHDWSLEQGWMTDEFGGGAPFGVDARWRFDDDHDSFSASLAVTIAVNRKNLEAIA
jgi:hypothetical protein